MSDASPECGDEPGLRIREVAERTGISEATLRMWESRHGFPSPGRTPSGHRRYAAGDVERLAEVKRERSAGMSLRAAIERASRAERRPRSIFSALRERRPDLQVHRLPKRVLTALSRAIEDESAMGAESLVLLGSFQRERQYRRSERRWRDLARGAEITLVFADFDDARLPGEGPVEIPIERSDPLAREWAIVCDGADRSACLAGWEPPGQGGVRDAERIFETIWTVEREAVREAARTCASLAESAAPDVSEALASRLEEGAPASRVDELQGAISLANRMIAYLARPAPPAPLGV